MNDFHRLWFLIVCGALIVLFAVFSLFARLEKAGIQNLLNASDEDVRAMVQKALPESNT